MADVSFKISSGLKNIIGRELITDDFIAVFELVKNSFDANAREVEIIFQCLKSETPSIIIKDNGEGMDEDDIRNKWLFVAYSAKKSDQDYRDKIKSDRIFAGAKGIGRFSCDRLGAKLRLITRRKTEKNGFLILNVNWNEFEEDPEKEFQTIKATLSKTNRLPIPQFKSGTILEISGLRSADWDRKKLLRLRRSLERLINPNQGNDADNFSIILKVPDEEDEDEVIRQASPDESWNIVNGPIKNFIFEALGLKTTQIQLEIGKKGDTLITELLDRGALVYRILENNPYHGVLHNIKMNLFFLNTSAKIVFARRMGLPSVQYGSVFVYRNGFRIHPYGEARTDSLGLDRRKQQGYNRFLGSRELIGRIEITSENPYYFQETSSRDGGFIKDEAFESLIDLLFKYALSRLEGYVIELLKFGKGLEDLDLEDLPEISNPNSKELRKIVFDIVTKLTRSKDVIDIHYDPNILNILENRSAESITALLGNLKRISADQNNEELHKEILKAEKQVTVLKKAKEEAEQETEKERERAKQAEQEAKQAYARAQEAEDEARQAQAETQKAQVEAQEIKGKAEVLSTQNLFLKSVLSKDLQHVLNLHHTIGQDALTIDQFVENLLGMLKDGNRQLKPERLQADLERISYVARKIITVSRFATKANFRADAEEITADLISYIREYLLNIYGGFILDPYEQRIEILFNSSIGAEFVTRFTPIKVSIVFDNLISNSRKHKSKTIIVSVIEHQENQLVISFKDDGRGIPRKNIPSLFQIGFTTTEGSGLGLHHSRTTMEEMHGDITINENYKDGAEFILTFKKQ
ncbi:MAG: ATP-binding protein [Anaerolineae bacterium]